MERKIFAFLRSYSTEPVIVNRLIVSAFINFNTLSVKENGLLRQHLIEPDSIESEQLALASFLKYLREATTTFGLEHLIELFEFVISPSDKIVNGAIYTPSYVRNYIVEKLIPQQAVFDPGTLCCDISCGCGGFLLTIAQRIRAITGSSFSTIFEKNLFGLDITNYSLERTKLLLSLFALTQGEDSSFNFNLYQGNALDFDWEKNCQPFSKNKGFDIIAGNPPYVASRNMENDSANLLTRWSVTKTGHPDLYIPFFQIGYELLKNGGSLGYITVNTFFKSINGRALREYFSKESPKFTIINFGGEQVFKGRNTYTCLCFIQHTAGHLAYTNAKSAELTLVNKDNFHHYEYKDLNDWSGWNLSSSLSDSQFIKKIEAVGKPFSGQFNTRNGIATLKNDVYKFMPIREDKQYFYLIHDKAEIRVEKGICRNIVNANKLKTVQDLKLKQEKIIYPYTDENGRSVILPEINFKQIYPECYNYLCGQKKALAKRDKGEGNYEAWYAYGRRQSLDIYTYKLFFPHISERPSFVIAEDKDLLFYNGIAVISNDLEELKCLKCILESDTFYKYLKLVAKDYASGYISMSKNYIKNFGVLELSPDIRQNLLSVNGGAKWVDNQYNDLINTQ